MRILHHGPSILGHFIQKRFHKIMPVSILVIARGLFPSCSKALPESRPLPQSTPSSAPETASATGTMPDFFAFTQPEAARTPVSIPADARMTRHENEILAQIRMQDGMLVFEARENILIEPIYYDGANVIFVRRIAEAETDTIYKYSIETQRLKQIGKTFSWGAFRMRASWNHIFIVSASFTDEENINNCILYKIDPFEGTITEIQTCSSFWLPELFVSPAGAFVNVHTTTEDGKLLSSIDFYDAETGAYRTLCKETAAYNPDGTVTGKDIYVCGGSGGTLFYQVLTRNRQQPGEARNTSIMALLFNKENPVSQHIYTSEYQLQYINALGNILLINEYAYEKPLDQTGKILRFDPADISAPEVIEVEGVLTTNDILSAAFVGTDPLLMVTNQEVYSYSIKSGTISALGLSYITRSILSDGQNVFLCQPKMNDNGEDGDHVRVFALHTLPVNSNGYT